jgi:hypothetical protein
LPTSARRPAKRNRSSSIELVGKPVLTLGRAAVSERQITLEGGLQAQNFAGRGCRRCCTMCSHCRILCEVVSHTNSASTLPAMAGKPSISGVPFWRVFHCQLCTQHMPPMVLKHWQLHSNTALCSGVASAALCVSPLFLPFGSSFKCSKRDKTRQMRPKRRNFLWRCAAGKKALVGLSAQRKKGHFSVKKCDLGSW